MSHMTAGCIMTIYYTGAAEGDKLYIQNSGWSTYDNSLIGVTTDILTTGDGIYKLKASQEFIDAVLTNGLKLRRSNGASYSFSKVTITKYVPPVVPGYEILYEGTPMYIDWASTSYTVPSECLSNLAVGDMIHAYTEEDTEHTVHKFAIWYIGWKNVATDGNTTEPVSGHQTLEVTDVIYDRFVNNSMIITGYYYYLTKAVLEHPSRFVSVTMSADGLATFSHATEAIDVTWVKGLKAYKATVNGDKIVTERINEAVPANTGLILQGEPSTTYRIPFAASANAVTDNVLLPTDGSAITGYVLGKSGSKVGFFKVTDRVVDAGKAYIPASAAAARQLSIDLFGDETTGIETIDHEPLTIDHCYNLQGQRVNAGAKGLVIVNGKKVFNK